MAMTPIPTPTPEEEQTAIDGTQLIQNDREIIITGWRKRERKADKTHFIIHMECTITSEKDRKANLHLEDIAKNNPDALKI